MENLNTKKVQEFALKNPAATRVFDEFKIDYCCDEGLIFEESCRAAKADPEIVPEKIAKVLRSDGRTQIFEKLREKSLSELIDYIVEKHHAFTRDEIGHLTVLTDQVLHEHFEKYPELTELREVFIALCDSLIPHMRREELVVFPYFKSLEAVKEKQPFALARQSPVGVMMLDHERARELLEEMRRLTSDFTAPQDACPCLKSLYYGLSELGKDLDRHIRLENEILFPRAFKLEQEPHSG